MYIISLHHTLRHERYISLWRDNNAGYCYSREHAGFYPQPKKGYHDDESNMPITKEQADELFQPLPFDGETRMMIPNTKQTWEKLNLKMTRNGLKRKE